MNDMTMNYSIIDEIYTLLNGQNITISEASVILCNGMDVLTVEGTISGGLSSLLSTCKIELVWGLNEEVIKTAHVFVLAGNFKYLAEIPKKISTSMPCKIRVVANKKVSHSVLAKVY